MTSLVRFYTFSAPSRFYALASRLVPWLYGTAVLTGLLALYVGLLLAPTDATQGDAYRIIYVHVPAAWMSMVLYLAMAGWSVVGWATNAKLAFALSRAIAPTGAAFTVLALWTGALWGKPTWGAWWVWDARLTSELILLFLYIGYLAIVEGADDRQRGDKAGALLALVGVVNIPIIYFSVRWWNTLHQGATISMTSAPKMVSTMLMGMLLMTASFWAYSFAVTFARTCRIVLERESSSAWVRTLAISKKGGLK
jgi:heme exporter protein C